ncbi:MAG: IS110 family transposase [Ktedonobacteraceae bacterium]
MTLVSVDSVLGIDVAKAKVDIWFQRVQSNEKPKHQCYDTTSTGHQRLLAWLATQHVGQLHVCLEATGTYSDALALCLHQAGYCVSLVNPLRIKRYGESELRRIKTDKSDAALSCTLLPHTASRSLDAVSARMARVARLGAQLAGCQAVVSATGIPQQEWAAYSCRRESH